MKPAALVLAALLVAGVLPWQAQALPIDCFQGCVSCQETCTTPACRKQCSFITAGCCASENKKGPLGEACLCR